MQLNNIAIGPKAIVMAVVVNPQIEETDTKDIIESKITAREEPLPSFSKAMAALPAVVAEILETGPAWIEGLTLTKLTIRRTKSGTRSVILSCTKQLEVRRDFLHPIETPCVQIDPASEGESGGVELDAKLAKAITKAIHEAERYMSGERSQKLLNFDEAKDGLNALADKGRDPELKL